MAKKVTVENRPFTRDEANKVYTILEEECGAPASERDSFVFHQTRDGFPREWRFRGTLGFGGKFWRNDDRLYINCYREDSTEEKERVIARTNVRLMEFVDRVFDPNSESALETRS